MEGYWCYWHGGKGYSGVGLHVRKATFPDRPAFSHPAFDFEHRIVVADLGRTDGGVDLRAERRQGLPGQDAGSSRRWTSTRRRRSWRAKAVVLCGDLNVARTDRDVHPKERKPNVDRPAAGGARAARADHRSRPRGPRPRARSRQRRTCSPGGRRGATCAQRNIGWRLDYVLASEPLARAATRCPVFREVGTSDHGPVVAEFALAPGDVAGTSATGSGVALRAVGGSSKTLQRTSGVFSSAYPV